MLIFSVVIFVFSTLTLSRRPPLPQKLGVMTPSSYGSTTPGNREVKGSNLSLAT